jgi:hypothetical protein
VPRGLLAPLTAKTVLASVSLGSPVARPPTHYNTSAQIERLLEAARSRGIVLSIQRVQRSEDMSPALDAAKASGATALCLRRHSCTPIAAVSPPVTACSPAPFPVSVSSVMGG